MTTAVAKTKKDEIALLMSQNMKSLESVLPAHMDSKRFCRMAINCMMKNPALADCEPNSFVMSVINCGEMGLEPSLGQAALVPYQGKVTAQPMYQGLIELARRSGEIKNIYAEVVYEADEFEYELGLDPILKHKPNPDKQGALRYVYAVAKLKDDTKQFVVLTKAEVDKVRGSSQAAGSKFSPWNTWEGEMWKKTAIKRLCKMLPKSTELARAMTLDSQAESGKMQAPVMADLLGSTLNVDALSDEPETPPMTKPQATKPAPKKSAKKDKAEKAKDVTPEVTEPDLEPSQEEMDRYDENQEELPMT